MNHLNYETLQDCSRRGGGVSKNHGVTNEQMSLGALLRIADAIERIEKRLVRIANQRKPAKKRRKQ